MTLLGLSLLLCTILDAKRTVKVPPNSNADFFSQWNSFKDIEGYISRLASQYKSSVTLSSIGKSAEHRNLHLLSIGPTAPQHQLFIMGTMHGREWISPASILYLIKELLESFSALDPRTVNLFQNVQVHFLPVLNPDGYEFSRIPAAKSEAAREWRKNRRALCSKCERGAHGVDLNRNWGVEKVSWGYGATRATSEVFQGKRPFSEPENQAVRKWLTQKDRFGKIHGFLDVHCCSGNILPPYYYKDEPEAVRTEMFGKARRIAKAMRNAGPYNYRARHRELNFSDSNTGVGVDWIYGEGQAQNVFIVETRGNNSTLLADIFHVDESKIVPISKELIAGFWQLVAETVGVTQTASIETHIEEEEVDDHTEPQEAIPKKKIEAPEYIANKVFKEQVNTAEEAPLDDLFADLDRLTGVDTQVYVHDPFAVETKERITEKIETSMKESLVEDLKMEVGTNKEESEGDLRDSDQSVDLNPDELSPSEDFDQEVDSENMINDEGFIENVDDSFDSDNAIEDLSTEEDLIEKDDDASDSFSIEIKEDPYAAIFNKMDQDAFGDSTDEELSEISEKLLGPSSKRSSDRTLRDKYRGILRDKKKESASIKNRDLRFDLFVDNSDHLIILLCVSCLGIVILLLMRIKKRKGRKSM